MTATRTMQRDSSDAYAASTSTSTGRNDAAVAWKAAAAAALIVASLLSFAAGGWTARACVRPLSGLSVRSPSSDWNVVVSDLACQRLWCLQRTVRGLLLGLQREPEVPGFHDIRSTTYTYPPPLHTTLFESRMERRREILQDDEGMADSDDVNHRRNLSICTSTGGKSSVCRTCVGDDYGLTISKLPVSLSTPTTTAAPTSETRAPHRSQHVQDSSRTSACAASSTEPSMNRKCQCGDPHTCQAKPIVDVAALLESWIHPTLVVHEAATATATAPLRVAVLVGPGTWDSANFASKLTEELLVRSQSIHPDNAAIVIVNPTTPSFESTGGDQERNSPTASGIGCVRVRDAYDWIRSQEPHWWDIIYVDGSTLHADPHKKDKAADLLQVLARALSPRGVVSLWMQGPAQRLGSFESTVAFHNVLEQAQVDFRYILDYHEALDHQTLVRYGHHHHRRLVNYFGLLMKEEGGGSRHAQWRFASQAQVDLKLRKLLRAERASQLSYLDGATMMTFKFPSRLDEELYCRRQLNRNSSSACDAFGHGIDPAPSESMSEAMEVRTSTYGERSGRGVYATRDIPAGSYVTLRDCAEAVMMPPASVWLFWAAYEHFDMSYFRSMFAFLDGYGWFDTSQGDEVIGVETGMTTFMNHGCNGTYNNGLSLTKTEATLQYGDGPAAAGYTSDQGRYDPFSVREFPYFRCHKSCFTLRNVRAGEELLTNYLVFGGSDPGTLWEDTLAEVKAMCSGSELGLVQFYESTNQDEPQ